MFLLVLRVWISSRFDLVVNVRFNNKFQGRHMDMS